MNEGGWIARLVGIGERFRAAEVPIVIGPPFGIALETIPMHLPLPARIRTEFLDPIHLDAEPERASDEDHQQEVHDHVEAEIQAGMDRLAAKRRFPVFL